MKLGISVRVDVKKIDKARLYEGEKGTYLDMVTFIDTEEVDRYDNNGFISQSVSKEERDNKVQGPILGNCKLIWQEKAQADPADEQRKGYEGIPTSKIPF